MSGGAADRPAVLYVTDLAYPAQGRRYGDEDVALSARLSRAVHVALCAPRDVLALVDRFDAVVVRNSGPMLHHRREWEAFRERALAQRTPTFNPLTGRGDMQGKQYLVDLTARGEPVIPTVAGREGLAGLPDAPAYVVKPVLGADSIGLQVVPPDQLGGLDLDGQLVQPHVDLRYEVSFVYVGRRYCYALWAPDPSRRWALQPYSPTPDDLAFAQRFVDWNALDHGVQRVDACRTRDGGLLLVELEDLNPYLSLDLLDEATRDAFVDAMTASLLDLLR